MKTKYFLPLLLLSASCRAAPALKLSDFAYAAKLELEPGGAVYGLALPESVYAGVTRADLGDIRVFNGTGVEVPHRVIRDTAERQVETRDYELPLFPLSADKAPADALHLTIAQDRDGARVELDSRSDGAREAGVAGYILDAGQVRSRIDRLSLHWDDAAGGDGFLIGVGVDAGDDLEHWHSVVERASIADLVHLGQHLQRRLITFAPQRAHYFRIRFSAPDPTVELTKVVARGTSRIRQENITWRDAAVDAGREPGEYRFTNPGPLRVTRLQVGLPEQNTLVAADIESRAAQDRPWRLRAHAQLYRLRHRDGEVTNADVGIGGVVDRYWRLRVAQDGGGLGAGLPAVRVAWQPFNLVFVARGAGPFTLAWGSGRAAPLQLAADSPLSGAGRPGFALYGARIADSTLRPGGDAALHKPINWRQVLLWATLAGGALILVGMALRLFRQMNPRA